MKKQKCSKQKILKSGFTLLELLVVALIVGIIASIALPQYKRVVLKSQYSTLKNTAKTLSQSEELFYITNNRFGTLYELDIDIASIESSNKTIINDNISCLVQGISDNWQPKVRCTFKGKLSYQQSIDKKIRQCVAWTTDTNDIYNKICQQETENTYNCTGTYCHYYYK